MRTAMVLDFLLTVAAVTPPADRYTVTDNTRPAGYTVVNKASPAVAPAPRPAACCGCGPACGCPVGACPDGCSPKAAAPDQIAYRGEPAVAGYHLELGSDGVHWWWVRDGKTFAHTAGKGVGPKTAAPFPAGYPSTGIIGVTGAARSSSWSSGSYPQAGTFTPVYGAVGPGSTAGGCPPAG